MNCSPLVQDRVAMADLDTHDGDSDQQRFPPRFSFEREQRLEQVRIDRLLNEAASLRRAADIRAHVHAVEHAIEHKGMTAPTDEVARWARRALAQADRIDPVKDGRFFQRFEGDDSSEE
jgi:hypothetical protein